MADMVFRPRFHDVDSEREVVLEEIAMVDDNPSDLVHDLAAEAVFGRHPLGRPVIGSADVIETVSRRALQAYHRGAYVGANIVVAAAGNVDHRRFVDLLRLSRRAGREAASAGAEAGATGHLATLPLPAQGHRAVPRLPRGARDRPERRAPLRGDAARRHRRRLGVVPAVPGDPGEARDGVLGLHVRVAVRRRGPGRPLRRHARGEPRASASRSSPPSSATSAPAICGRASSSARRRTSRAACCSRSSRPRPG